MANNKYLRFALQLVISLGILGAFAFYLYINSDKYLELLDISNTGVFILILLSLTFPVLSAMQNTFLYRALGLAEFSYRDSYLITATSSLANQLPIPGGILSRGYYMKHKYNLSYAKYTSSTIALFFCYLAINGLIGIIVLVSWIVINKTTVPSILLIAFAMMMTCILVFWLPVEQIRVPEKMRQWTNQAVEGWTTISRNPDLLLKLIFLQIILVVLLALRYWVAFRMLSQYITMGQSLLFASASILTQLISIAPGGLGVREAIVASVATVLGFEASVSVVAIGLDRLVITFIIVITGWASTVILGRQIANIPEVSD